MQMYLQVDAAKCERVEAAASCRSEGYESVRYNFKLDPAMYSRSNWKGFWTTLLATRTNGSKYQMKHLQVGKKRKDFTTSGTQVFTEHGGGFVVYLLKTSAGCLPSCAC
ncbi:hypothetical protein ACJJTC_004634 [Scirpophaga incertulas]